MITINELKYVSSWATKTPYPGINYAKKSIEKLIDAVDAYEEYYMDKEYDIILSNGDQFKFQIMAKNLCHMLGIDYKNLNSEYHQKFREDILGITDSLRSYDFLKVIIENIDKVLKFDYENSGKILNYYRLMVKCSIFEKLSDFTKFNFGVIDFDKNTYQYISGSSYNGNTEKFLYVHSNEQNCPYFLMGILQGSEENYAVETLIAPTNIKDFFNNQNVAIPTQILVTTNDTMDKFEATPSEKLALLNQYKALIREYLIANNINIYADYLATLTTQENDYNSRKKRIL
ncbi:MAG: hypothetical protein E7172_06515 [Firmicutes bacterium]|nr:hypothetical protein [Bacillota bacterium]